MEERTVSLIGEAAYGRLAQSHVIVFGTGGVGCYCVEALARAGVGKLTLADGDVFAPSNLNRQLYALTSTIGKSKTEAAKERVQDINPDCRVTAVQKRVCESDIADILNAGADFVCDAVDDVPAKVAVAKLCGERQISLISCMGAGNRIGTEPFEITDIFKTQNDPLAKAMRRRLREAGIKSLTVCYSQELPYAPGRTPPASISYVPAMAGLAMAGHVIRSLAGLEAGK